jgi:hypothetical protein
VYTLKVCLLASNPTDEAFAPDAVRFLSRHPRQAKFSCPEYGSFLDAPPHHCTPRLNSPPYDSEIAISENKLLESRRK